MADDDSIPPSPDAYRAVIPGFENARVDVNHEGYRAAAAAAHAAGMSHRQWQAMLTVEARRVQAAQKAAPAAQQTQLAEDWSKLSFQQKLMRAGHL